MNSAPHVTAADVAAATGGRLRGDPEAAIRGVCTLANPAAERLAFARDLALLENNDPTRFGVVLLAPAGAETLVEATCILVDEPRLAFAQAANRFFALCSEPTIAASAAIDPSVRIGKRVSIGEHCVLSGGVRIGDDTIVRHGVVLGPRVEVGSRCVIGSNTVIGEVGFGLAKQADGRNLRIPHIGSVVIEDDVEIGALTSIASGTIDPTRIGAGAKIDDHVFIAHNVQLGENVMVIACAELSGSVRVGANTWIGPNVSVRDGLTIAADSLVGIGSTVVKSLEEPGIYMGSPAKLVNKA